MNGLLALIPNATPLVSVVKGEAICTLSVPWLVHCVPLLTVRPCVPVQLTVPLFTKSASR